MRQRIVEVLGVATVIAVVALAMSVAGQTPQPGQTGQALKTSWGEPDLQGIWGIQFQVPLQRPVKFKDKEFFTEEEIKQLDAERAVKPTFGDKRAEKGTEQDLAGAYDSRVFLQHRHAGRRTSLIVDPPNGRLPPRTPELEKRLQEMRQYYLATIQATEACKNKWRDCAGGTYNPVPSPRVKEPLPDYPAGGGFPFAGGGGWINRADGPEDHGLGMRCLSAQLPDFASGGTGGFWFIAQSPGAVSIFYDTGQGQGWHRPISMDGSPHLPSSIRLWWGDSRGRWEGNTLVIDVTNFSRKTNYLQARENLHLVERWTRTSPTSIEYIVTVDDPTTWTRPWTAKQEFTKQDTQANRIYKEPRCVEGNYSIEGWLWGARVKEQAFAEGRGPDPGTANYSADTLAALEDEDLDDLR
jgi:hypothetical protein